MKELLRILFLVIMVCCWSCSSDEEDVPTPKPSEKPKVEITSIIPVWTQEGGTETVTFTSTEAWTIDVTEGRATSWCSISPISGGKGTNTLTIKVMANDTYDERNARVSIKAGLTSQAFTVTQKQKDGLTVTSNKVELKAEGGDFSIEAKANVEISYEIEEDAQTWISVNESRGLTAKTLNFTAKANEGVNRRQGNIILKGGDGLTETVTVYQEGEEVNLVLTTEEKMLIGSDGGILKIELKSNSEVQLEDIKEDWVRLSEPRGMSDYTYYFEVEANDTYDERNAAITFISGDKKQMVTITQKQQDALIITSNKVALAANEQRFSIEVKANVEVSYEIEKEAQSWISITESRGLTTNTLIFTAKPNEGVKRRQGNIILKGGDGLTETVTVYQDGEEPTLVISSDDIMAKSEGETIKIELKSNVDYVMNLPEVDWLSEESSRAISTYTHYLKVAPNDTYDQRSAVVIFYNESEELKDSVTISQLQKDAIIVAKKEYVVDFESQTLEFKVNSNVNFDVSTSVDWMKLHTGSRALVEKSLAFEIQENESEEFREGEIVITYQNLKQTIKVKQEGVVDYAEIERTALIEFYKAAGGDNWVDNTNWCSDKPLSEWKGISLNSEGRVRSISLLDNNLTGYISSEIGKLRKLTFLDLEDNKLGGNIPLEINTLTKLFRIYLGKNQLTGEIPKGLDNLTNLILLDLGHNQLSGNIPVELGNLKATSICLEHNQLSGNIPVELGNHRRVKLDLSHNNLTGVIPASLVLTDADKMKLSNNKLSGYISDEVTFSFIWKHVWNLDDILPQQEGYELTYSNSQGYARDCELLQLQKHTKGNGIKVVVAGDGYTEQMIKDGTYEATMREAMEGFFCKEPFTTYRDYFDFYAYFAVSVDEGIGGNTAFRTRYGENRYVELNDNLCVKRLSTAFAEIGCDLSNVTAAIILNDEESWGTYNCSWYADGFSLSNVNIRYSHSLILHEANGHGFGLLDDEYVEREVTLLPYSFKELHEKGERMNVDGISDPDKIGWAYFLKDERYASEKIGIYEGACHVRKGRFRATEMSIMNWASEDLFFNAPSRWGIYQRIMKLAGEEYSFEDFLEYDAVNRAMYDELEKSGRSVKKVNMEMSKVKGAPPVYYDYPSSEILLKDNATSATGN